jgi:hypothetical protein
MITSQFFKSDKRITCLPYESLLKDTLSTDTLLMHFASSNRTSQDIVHFSNDFECFSPVLQFRFAGRMSHGTGMSAQVALWSPASEIS